jgi:hypothetical protein
MTNVQARPISFVLFTAAVLLIAMIVACSNNEPTPSPTPELPQVTASEAVELSKTAMSQLESFRFKLSHDSGHTTLSGALELTVAGGVVTPGGLDLNAEANIGRAFVRVEAIVIDERTWMTNPLTGVWSEIPPEDSPFSFLDPVKLVADILGKTQQPVFPDSSPKNGEIKVAGQIPAPVLAALVGRVDRDAIPDVMLTFDAVDYRLKKIVISGIVQPEDEATTVRVITLSEFDDPVSLEPPI